MLKVAVDLKGKSFLKLNDFTKEELLQILDTADYLKLQNKLGNNEKILKGKTLGMIFEKSSTRTRVSFEVGMYQLGGSALFLSSKDIQIGRGETIADTAKVLSRYVDGIMIRTYSQNTVEELAEEGTIPVINGLTDKYHPCQIMADFQTIREKFGKLEGLKLAYVGDSANVANSLLVGGAILGMDISIASPKSYQPKQDIIGIANEEAAKTSSNLLITEDVKEAVIDADVLYTDVWVSMGKEEEKKKRLADLKDYQINADVMKLANKDAIVMHCLPAHRGEEITADVIDGPQSVVFDEAENRLHAQKAIMALLMG
jgi:ornithine carbamoyltransferase